MKTDLLWSDIAKVIEAWRQTSCDQGPVFLFSTYRKLRWDELSKLFLLTWAHAHCEQCLGFFVLQEPDLTWDGFTVSMRPYPWTLLRANTPSVLRAAYLHNFLEWSLRKGRWVYDVTKQTLITLNNLSAYHGRLVKGLRASTRRNPWKRIFLGMREGVGGKQGGMGRDTIRSCI